ncbi:hypothetical protein H5410_017325 [Solanum commersonii]|uniref:Uncharacterized protein n=1 Tax=Solanum commersonii TaxID=4109 RepID=A0A9J5ZYU5_SOLCO|nr:hypothetical protein H5410_017325 [Solanum commersonii]
MGNDVGEHGQEVSPDEMINGWGNNGHKDEKEPSEDFLNDEETDNGDVGTQRKMISLLISRYVKAAFLVKMACHANAVSGHISHEDSVLL